MDDPLSELQVLTSKRSSLRDKLKKRREALGSILAQTSSTETSVSNNPNSKNSEDSSNGNSEKIDETSEKKIRLEPPEVKSPPEVRSPPAHIPVPRKRTSTSDSESKNNDDILSLLQAQSAKEKADQQHRDEILELLGKPTAKEQVLIDSFRSQTGSGVKEFCSHSTKVECMKFNESQDPCEKLHFAKILQPHTDESLGDCSFLNTCFHMDTCKYIHYEVDAEDIRKQRIKSSSPEKNCDPNNRKRKESLNAVLADSDAMKLVPPQWVQCDLRNLNLSTLGKFTVVMADPPWDIHMELPYGTMSDDEMRHLPVQKLQDEGLIFLWVTGRAMELGRECLKIWGYERVDEIIWVKTNQLQRIIRTGRTGHWLNHGKEHCLVGLKGSSKLNRGIDCDVIVAEVRATSHKPDEIYGLIERLSPGTRKIELFGRPHNVQPNWVTLGNQLDGIVIHDEEMLGRWNKAYPNGYDLVKGLTLHSRLTP